MATVQRLNRHSPSDDELEQVRSKALARLAAMADRDRAHEPDAAPDEGATTSVKDGGTDVIEAEDATVSAAEAEERTADEMEGGADASRPRIIVLGAPPADGAGDASDAESADGAASDQAVLFPSASDGDPIEQIQAEVLGEEGGMTQVDLDRSGSIDTVEPVTSSTGARPPIGVMAPPPAATPIPIGAMPAYCPYCATYLDPAPTEDTRCHRCKSNIVVRHADGRTVLLVESAVPVFEAERQRLLDEAQWARERDHWLTLALMSGAPRDRIAKAAAEPPSKARITSARTLYLTTVDKSFETAARAGRWDDAAQIRYAEALVLFDAAGVPIPRPPTDLPKAPLSERKGGTTD